MSNEVEGIFPPVMCVRNDRGVIVPINGQVMSAQQMQATIPALASLPYDGPDKADYAGMTNFEVANLKAIRRAAILGDIDTVEKLNDRVIGKPLAKSVQVTGTLGELLDAMKGGVSKDAAVIDVDARADGDASSPFDGL